MKKLLLLLIFVCLVKRLSFPLPALAAEIAGSSAVLAEKFPAREVDPRVKQLEIFFQSYDSPLATYSAYFVKMADKYEIDWKLLPAIAGVESTFGKRIPVGSYNAYGWNGGNARFDSWEAGIEEVCKNLREKYYERGLKTPYLIAPVYCPPSLVWAGKVVFFMQKIGEFEKEAWLQAVPLVI